MTPRSGASDGFRVVRVFGKVAAVAALGCLMAACASASVPGAAAGRGGEPRIVRADPPKQCVPYARGRSGLAIYGDAHTWWDQAEGTYARGSRPQVGAVMVLAGYAGPKRAHLAVVTKILSPRKIIVDHANWLNDGNIYLDAPVTDASRANDWSEVMVWNTRDGHMGGRRYQVQGFIGPGRPGPDDLRVAARF